MLEWLETSFHNDHVEFNLLVSRLAASFLVGCVVAGIYILTRRGTGTEVMATTLLLLTILIAMVTLIIGNNVARAFSLAGALAIIRFRTVVEDTRDTAFVIFAVVVGMGMGAGMVAVSLVGIPLVAAAAFLFAFLPRTPAASDYSLTVRMSIGRDPDADVKDTFDKYLKRFRLTATSTARQGSAFELTYMVTLAREDALVPLVADLNRTEGVQAVELRQI